LLEKYTVWDINIIHIIRIGIIMKKVILLALIASFATTVFPHGGRTDKNGCHNETKTGTRHCH